MAGKVSWGLGLNVEFWGEKGDLELNAPAGAGRLSWGTVESWP